MTENVTNEKMKTQNDGDIVIDLQALFSELLKAAPIIIVVALVGAILGFLYSSLFTTPMYQASTSIYVLSRNSDTVSQSDLQLGSSLVQDYAQIIKSRTVCERVLAELEIDNISPSQLSNMISVDKAGNSARMLVISVSSSSPTFCQTAANAVREEAADYIVEVMELPGINTVDEAKLPTSPYNTGSNKTVLYGFFGGFVLTAGIVVLRYLLNDSITSEEDVKNRLHLSVLGSVPIDEDENDTKKKSTFRKYVDRIGYSVKRHTRKH